MGTGTVEWRQRSAVPAVPPARPRKLAKVPFVELADGQLHGVVSSGSDITRVYVSAIAAGSHSFSCSTNNNRPCGGLRGAPCRHLCELVDEAVAQFGAGPVVRYLRVDVAEGAASGAELLAGLRGAPEPAAATATFNRFLRHLAYLELPVGADPVPEMQWFPAVAAVR